MSLQAIVDGAGCESRRDYSDSTAMLVLEALADFATDHHGRPPTRREAGAAVGIRSTSHVNYNLSLLARAGLVGFDGAGSHPYVTDAGWLALEGEAA